MLRAFITAVRFVEHDIVMGWEMQKLSIGHIIDRAAHLKDDSRDFHLIADLGRVVAPDEERQFESKPKDEYGADKASRIHLVGRVLLNV